MSDRRSRSAAARPLEGLLPRLRGCLNQVDLRPPRGRILRIVGTIVEAAMAEARLGELCILQDRRSGRRIPAEVVGLASDRALLTPIGEVAGLSSTTEVVSTADALRVPVGPELLGRVLDSLGRPLDERSRGRLTAKAWRPVTRAAPDAISRRLVETPLSTGVRAIDALLTCGEGQRIGIYGEPGSGKSSLLAQIVRNTAADVAVLALIGERGREAREFVERQLGPEGLARSVIVVATSDRPAMERVKAAHIATTIAEAFRDEGRRVLLVMDSVTRFARALREIGLAAGEPPTRRGFPPSVFAELPRLLERTGPGVEGSITAFYTVLMEGDGTLDPIAEETRAILDGHIMLSAELGHAEHFPAIDVLRSRSRVMDGVVSADHRSSAQRVRSLLARYAEIELLLRVGEYRAGSDPLADRAIAGIDAIRGFLRQPMVETSSWPATLARLATLGKP